MKQISISGVKRTEVGKRATKARPRAGTTPSTQYAQQTKEHREALPMACAIR